MKLAYLALGGTFAVLAVAAFASIEDVPVFNRHYGIKPDSRLGRLTCMVCHVPSDPAKLGPYGRDLERAMKALNTTRVTPAVLRRVEQLDSDRDGVRNLVEIRADSSPNDPKVRPARPARPPARPARPRQ